MPHYVVGHNIDRLIPPTGATVGHNMGGFDLF